MTTQEIAPIPALTQLFEEAGKAHHQAFLATNGADPAWPAWYAAFVTDRLNDLLRTSFSQAQVADLLVALNHRYDVEDPIPGWPEFYAQVLVDEYAGSLPPSPRVLVFDVNETLLDLNALRPHFEGIFGDAGITDRWFALVLRTAMTLTIIGEYMDFAQVGGEALEMVARSRGVTLSAEQKAAIAKGMRTLPPHPEVPAALARLKEAGFRLAALTNSPPDQAVAQLSHAGLAPLFEQILSVDGTGCFKPHRIVYEFAAEQLGVSTQEMRMVAAHDWDIAGAMAAGCAGAFIARPGMVLGPNGPKPDVVGADLDEVATQLLAQLD